jgi:DNA-binding IclR family transcriptional regulator
VATPAKTAPVDQPSDGLCEDEISILLKEKLTDATLTDPDELRRELERIRQSGYSITVADVQPFTGSMAAPIRDASGTVVASLCFIARKTLIQNVQRRDTLLEHLLHAAHLASMDLGWRPDPV